MTATEHVETIAGLVERVTFHSAETGFAVLRVKARGRRDLVTVVGSAAMISAGEWITASGVWVNDRTHGLQLRAKSIKTAAPTSREGIQRYLGSGVIKGIGPHFAKRLVGAFGDQVFDVIETSPDKLRGVDGVGPVRQARIIAGWAEQKAVREIMLFLHKHGVSTARAVRIYKTYGDEAVEIMTGTPLFLRSKKKREPSPPILTVWLRTFAGLAFARRTPSPCAWGLNERRRRDCGRG